MILEHFEVLLPLELLSLGELGVCGLQQLHLLLEEDELLRVLEGREVVRVIVDVRAQLLERALDFLQLVRIRRSKGIWLLLVTHSVSLNLGKQETGRA